MPSTSGYPIATPSLSWLNAKFAELQSKIDEVDRRARAIPATLTTQITSQILPITWDEVQGTPQITWSELQGTPQASLLIDRGSASSAVDWNTYTTAGIYRVGGSWTGSNQPSGAYGYGTLVVYVSGNSVTQVYYPHGAPAASWFRTKWNTSDWEAWSNSDILADARIAIAKPLISGKIMSLVRNSYSALTSLTNRGGFASISNATTITIPKTGNYQINFALLVAVASALYFKLMVNDVVDYHGYTPGATGGWMGDMRIHVSRYLTSGTRISLGIDTNDTNVSSWTGMGVPHNDFSIAFTGE